ncbi:TetR/AcrR family transcriptional regulator [Halobacillus fulvus]|nr:TetR/AcrR family transcriptional regulator [Halobacillus fulvus]
MGRKKVLTKKEIYNVTGHLLREEGLKGVHFKKLAQKLEVGRSTLYEYFRNRDDLLLAYMKSLMDDMNEQVDRIDPNLPPNKKLYELLVIILHHAEIHQIDHMIKELQSSNKHAAMFYKNELDVDLMKTYENMMDWIEESKETGIWSEQVDSALIGDLIFHAIMFPNRKRMGVEALADQLFRLIEKGVSLDS